MKEELMLEAIELFRSTPVYHRLLKAVKKRFQQLGRFGGTIALSNLSAEDREALSRFFARNFTQQEQVRIPLQDVVKALEATRFAQISLIDLLEAYFEETLVTEAELAEEWQQNWEHFFDRLLAKHPHEYCQRWLTELATRQGVGYKLVLKLFNQDCEKLQNELTTVCTALSRLPALTGKRVRLPIFAAEITKDPHGLDQWTEAGHLFQAALATVFAQTGSLNGEQQALLYQKAGILKGDIASYVTTYGLLALGDSETCQELLPLRNVQVFQDWQILEHGESLQSTQTFLCHQLHPLWYGALMVREVLQLTLDNLFRVSRVFCANKRVYVLENPAVFAELVEACGDRNISLICSNGQLRLATWVLLDLLVEEGAQIVYSGDFDPEGLGIAQRLAERYPGNVSFWHYTVEDYDKALSNVEISEKRLNKLITITDEDLLPVKDAMLQRKMAGYQEQLVQEMVAELQRG